MRIMNKADYNGREWKVVFPDEELAELESDAGDCEDVSPWDEQRQAMDEYGGYSSTARACGMAFQVIFWLVACLIWISH